MTIDTLEYAKKLEAAGIDRRQAEVHAEALRSVTTVHFATKADLDAAVLRLDSKIDRTTTYLEMRLIKYMVVQAVVTVTLVFMLLRLVPN